MPGTPEGTTTSSSVDVALHQQVVDRQVHLVRVQAQPDRQRALRVEVDQQHLAAVLGQRGAQVDRGRGLADPALLVAHRDHAGVAVRRSDGRGSGNSGIGRPVGPSSPARRRRRGGGGTGRSTGAGRRAAGRPPVLVGVRASARLRVVLAGAAPRACSGLRGISWADCRSLIDAPPVRVPVPAGTEGRLVDTTTCDRLAGEPRTGLRRPTSRTRQPPGPRARSVEELCNRPGWEVHRHPAPVQSPVEKETRSDGLVGECSGSRRTVAADQVGVVGVVLDPARDEGALGDHARPPSARTSSRAPRASAEPTPLPSKRSSTSVWVKTMTAARPGRRRRSPPARRRGSAS